MYYYIQFIRIIFSMLISHAAFNTPLEVSLPPIIKSSLKKRVACSVTRLKRVNEHVFFGIINTLTCPTSGEFRFMALLRRRSKHAIF
jgi:hypothetical protein